MAQFSVTAAETVRQAFIDLAAAYDPIGRPILYRDIARQSGLSHTLVAQVAREAEWWTTERKAAQAAGARHHWGKVYERNLRIEQAFHAEAAECDAVDKPVMPSAVCKRAGVTMHAFQVAAHQSTWWAKERQQAAKQETLRLATEAHMALGNPGLKKAHQVSASRDYPGIRAMHHTQQAQGYESNRVNLTKVNMRRSGSVLSLNHARRLQGTITRQRITEAIDTWPAGESLSSPAVGRKLGLSEAIVHRYAGDIIRERKGRARETSGC